MIETIALIMVLLTATIPALNKYFKAKINVKFHIYLAYITLILVVISLVLMVI